MTPPDVQLGLMLDLPENWDGYGADRIDPAVVEVAQEFVRLLTAIRRSDDLYVAPGRDGGVGVEWEEPGTRYSLDVNPDGTMQLLRVCKASGAMTTERFDPKQLVSAASMFGAVRRLVAA